MMHGTFFHGVSAWKKENKKSLRPAPNTTQLKSVRLRYSRTAKKNEDTRLFPVGGTYVVAARHAGLAR